MKDGEETMQVLEVLRAACCVAGIDGQVSEREDPLLRHLADEAGVGRVSLEAMIERAEHDHDFYREHFDLIKTDPEQTIRTILRVATADGTITDAERSVVGHFAAKLGLSEKRLGDLIDAAEQETRGRKE